MENASQSLDQNWSSVNNVTSRENRLNYFLASLAFAEKAAAHQCKIISEQFKNSDRPDLYELYQEFMREEETHFQKIASLCDINVPIPTRANEIYVNGLMEDSCSIVERLVSVHLVFEPSALAYLGYFTQNIKKLTLNDKRADEIKTIFSQILREEVSHVYTGNKLIREMIENISPEERRSITRTVRKQRFFLRTGLKTFFSEEDDSSMIAEMTAKYDYHFLNQTRGILNDTLEVTA